MFGREACREASTHGGCPGGDGGRGSPSAEMDCGPAVLPLWGPRLGWLWSCCWILPGPCEAPRPVPFRLGCSVAALVFTPIPQHLHSLVGSPDLQGLLLENGTWCWPSCQLSREALGGVNSKGPGEAQTLHSPRTPHRPGARASGNCNRACGLTALLPLQRGQALTFAEWVLRSRVLKLGSSSRPEGNRNRG